MASDEDSLILRGIETAISSLKETMNQVLITQAKLKPLLQNAFDAKSDQFDIYLMYQQLGDVLTMMSVALTLYNGHLPRINEADEDKDIARWEAVIQRLPQQPNSGEAPVDSEANLLFASTPTQIPAVPKWTKSRTLRQFRYDLLNEAQTSLARPKVFLESHRNDSPLVPKLMSLQETSSLPSKDRDTSPVDHSLEPYMLRCGSKRSREPSLDSHFGPRKKSHKVEPEETEDKMLEDESSLLIDLPEPQNHPEPYAAASKQTTGSRRLDNGPLFNTTDEDSVNDTTDLCRQKDSNNVHPIPPKPAVDETSIASSQSVPRYKRPTLVPARPELANPKPQISINEELFPSDHLEIRLTNSKERSIRSSPTPPLGPRFSHPDVRRGRRPKSQRQCDDSAPHGAYRR